MRMYIGNKDAEGFDFTITPDALKHKGTHLFIASNSWDEVLINLCDVTDPKGIEYLTAVCSNIKVELPEKSTPDTLKVLSKIYPDKAAVLRKAFLKGGDFSGIL